MLTWGAVVQALLEFEVGGWRLGFFEVKPGPDEDGGDEHALVTLRLTRAAEPKALPTRAKAKTGRKSTHSESQPVARYVARVLCPSCHGENTTAACICFGNGYLYDHSRPATVEPEVQPF